MSDWEIWAPTQAQLVTVAKAIVNNRNVNTSYVNGQDGFVIEGFLNNGTRFCINYYKQKYMPTGNTFQEASYGPLPEKARITGVFAIMRWLHPTNVDPPQPSQASGVTLVPLPADSPFKFV